MSKFLLGRVKVQTMEFDGELTLDQITEMGNIEENWIKENTRMTEYEVGWTEGGVMNPELERNKILTAFLKLMNSEIPKANYEKPRIIGIGD